jgi:uncharacterized phiE125 gp8 family phage protein
MTSVIEPPALDDAVAEAKVLLRIDASSEDGILARFVGTAAGLCEAFTGLWLLPREGSEIAEACSCWQRLRATPVRAITQLETVPAGGEPALLTAEAFSVDIDAAGDGWVRLHATGYTGRVRVGFEAGLAASAAWADLPEALRHGILRLAAHLYTHRDRAEPAAEPPAAVTALWRPWRRMRIK